MGRRADQVVMFETAHGRQWSRRKVQRHEPGKRAGARTLSPRQQNAKRPVAQRRRRKRLKKIGPKEDIAFQASVKQIGPVVAHAGEVRRTDWFNAVG